MFFLVLNKSYHTTGSVYWNCGLLLVFFCQLWPESIL